MIAVVLVLINLTTLILLSSIEDGLQTWRLSQHDMQLARAWRAADSARFYALSRFQQGLPIPTTVPLSSGWQVVVEQRSVNCANFSLEKMASEKMASDEVASEEEPPEYQCWSLDIDIQLPKHQLRVSQHLLLMEDQYGERRWQINHSHAG